MADVRKPPGIKDRYEGREGTGEGEKRRWIAVCLVDSKMAGRGSEAVYERRR